MKRIGSMSFFLLALLLPALVPCLGWANPGSGDQAPGRDMAQQATKGAKRWITADHSKHEALKQPFAAGPEVTKACHRWQPLGGRHPDPQDHPLDLGRPRLPQGQADGQGSAHGQ
jgi:hypothetical protein